QGILPLPGGTDECIDARRPCRQRGSCREAIPGLVVCVRRAAGIESADLPIVGGAGAQVGNAGGGGSRGSAPGAVALIVVDDVVAVLVIIRRRAAAPGERGAQTDPC